MGHRDTRRRLAGGAIAATLLLLSAGAAQALSIYAEVSTSDLAGNFTARADLTAEFDPFDLDVYTNAVGAGLGNAEVTDSIVHTHTFAPGTSSASVISASLFVSVVDDFDIFSGEVAELSLLDGGSWTYLDGGQATLNILGGSATAQIQQVGDSVTYKLTMLKGDTLALGSALVVKYREGGGVIAGVVPEPTAALLFGAGAVVLSRRRRTL